jgi:predicted nucleotidyltransferase
MTLLTSALSIPKEITQFFAEYLRQLQAILPDRVYGCYLYGSVSLGAYDPANSDLDVMIVLSHALNDDEIVMISHLHAQMCNALPLVLHTATLPNGG